MQVSVNLGNTKNGPGRGADGQRSSRWSGIDVAALGAVILCAALIVPVHGTTVGNNAATYLIQASNMAGGGLVAPFSRLDMVRGPLFPLLIRGAFEAGGKSVYAALMVVRVCFALSIILTFVLAFLWYGRLAAVAASALVLVSPGLNQIAGNIDTDIVLPTFVLIFFCLYALTVERQSYACAVASGSFLGLGILVKESALVFAALPVLMMLCLPRQMRRRQVRLSAIVLGATVVVLMPWLVKVYLVKGSLLPALGVASPEYQNVSARMVGYASGMSYWFHVVTKGLLPSLKGYYEVHLSQFSPLTFPILAAWTFVTVAAALTRRPSWLMPVVALVCFAPIVLRSGDMRLRLGQSTVVFYLSYLVLAGALVQAAAWLPRVIAKRQTCLNPERSRLLVSFVIVALTGCLTSLQLFSNPSSSVDPTWRFWNNRQLGLQILGAAPFRVRGRFTDDQEDAARWLLEKGPETSIVADGYSHEALDFFMNRKEPTPAFDPLVRFRLSEDENPPDLKERRHLIYLFTYGSFQRGPKRLLVMFCVFQEDIVSALEERRADYLVISDRGSYLRSYLDRVPWARLERESGSTLVYRIDRGRPDFGVVDLPRIGPTLHVRSGDGTLASISLSDEFKRYEAEGRVGEKDTIYFYIDSIGEFYLDAVSFKEGGNQTAVERLAEGDRGFETAGGWESSGDHLAERIVDPRAPQGRYVLKVVASAAGDGVNRISLSHHRFEYEKGRPCTLAFYARSSSVTGFLCVNASLSEDLDWLERKHPSEYRRALKLLELLQLTPAELKGVPCRLTVTP